jgi:hypothetical protein
MVDDHETKGSRPSNLWNNIVINVGCCTSLVTHQISMFKIETVLQFRVSRDLILHFQIDISSSQSSSTKAEMEAHSTNKKLKLAMFMIIGYGRKEAVIFPLE